MNKMQAYQAAQDLGADFVANVILTQHRNAAAKLKGLVEILKAGHEVRTAQFSMDTLLIDGEQRGWEILESPVLVARWRGRKGATMKRYERPREHRIERSC